MRVFVTGATGFIGRALTARLRADGHTVVAWVRSMERPLLNTNAYLESEEPQAESDPAQLTLEIENAIPGED